MTYKKVKINVYEDNPVVAGACAIIAEIVGLVFICEVLMGMR